MSLELTVLAWGCILGIAQIFVAAQLATRQYGAAWGMSARDEPVPPPSRLVGRMTRARSNFLETFPFAAAAILVVEVTGTSNGWTQAGAVLWLAARIVYVPTYALGVPLLRSLIFLASIVGVLMVLSPALF
jgi:uncharacterized MAPEG superfamily protein